MPLAPGGGLNVRAHFRLQEGHRGEGTPGAAQPNMRHAGFRGKLTAPKHKAIVLRCLTLSLCRDVAALMYRSVNLAILEDALAVAEDEIDVSFDVAIVE